MEIYLQTRGITHDYAFLGKVPPEYWWSTPLYKDATSFEQPSLILERLLDGGWRCFISAIPSARRDRVNTRIRYSLVINGKEPDQRLLRKLLAYVLDIFRSNLVSENNPLTKQLDDIVGDHADEWLRGSPEQTQPHIDKLKERLDQLPSLTREPRLNKELEGLLTNAPNSPRIAAILNFIGKDNTPLTSHLRSQLKPSQGKILILESPVAGGKLDKYFVLSSSRHNLTTENAASTRQLPQPTHDNTQPSLASGEKGCLGKPFHLGSQGHDPEGPNTRCILDANSERIVNHYDKEEKVVVTIALIMLLMAGWYMVAN